VTTDEFAGKVVLVTGGASGIGFETAQILGRRGAKVALASRNEAKVADAVAKITATGASAHGIRADVTRDEDVFRMVRETVAVFGRLDGAVNNAGIIGPIMGLVDYDLSAARQVIEANMTSVLVCMQTQLKIMIPQRSGSIVNVGSIWSITAGANYAAYCAAKHGVAGMTKAVALETGRLGIRVNAVCPGFTYTPMISDSGLKIKEGSKEYKEASESQVLGRMAHPSEVAEGIVWLLSEASSYATGTLLSVDGGFNAR
jgi:NAD(P)-dependent dehydrogenase (short-subunit alcohol dehydrogenase family)